MIFSENRSTLFRIMRRRGGGLHGLSRARRDGAGV